VIEHGSYQDFKRNALGVLYLAECCHCLKRLVVVPRGTYIESIRCPRSFDYHFWCWAQPERTSLMLLPS
jgi:hypothetical protein